MIVIGNKSYRIIAAQRMGIINTFSGAGNVGKEWLKYEFYY